LTFARHAKTQNSGYLCDPFDKIGKSGRKANTSQLPSPCGNTPVQSAYRFPKWLLETFVLTFLLAQQHFLYTSAWAAHFSRFTCASPRATNEKAGNAAGLI
jgi:hypothetical protein